MLLKSALMHIRRSLPIWLCLLIAACGTPEKGTSAKSPVPVVRTVIANAQNGAPFIQMVGTAAWRQETPLGFTSDGQIARVLVNEGEIVRAGQLLATLDTTPIAAELAAVQAEARRAQSDAARINQLYRKGWVTKQRLESAQAGAQASAAEAQARQFALRTARIVAPGPGVVLARLAEPTQVVAKGTPVLVLGEGKAGYVLRAPVNDRVAAALRIGMPATVSFDAMPLSPLQGRILEIGGRARQTTGTFDVEILLPETPGLRSGMIGTAKVLSAQAAPATKIVLPANAILSPRAGEALVYVVDTRARARVRQVAIGETTDNGIEILAGVRAGEQVVLSGFDKLSDGVPVMPKVGGR